MAGFFSHTDASKGQTKKVNNKLPRCGQCGNLKHTLSPKLEVRGRGDVRVLFVNDSPMASGARIGEHFAGDTGAKLQDMLLDIGQDLEDCLSTSAVICGRSDNKSVEPYMISACRPYLYKTIKEQSPDVIIPLGIDAVSAVLTEDYGKKFGPMDRWSGWSIPSHTFDCWVCPIHAPYRIFQMKEDKVCEDEYKRNLRNAFDHVGKKPKYQTIDELEAQVEIITNPRQAYKRMKDLAKKKGTLAFDYEATGVKPERKKQELVSVSFCLDGKDTWACMLDHPKVIDEFKNVLLSEKLRKIASNLKYEERWTKCKLGIKVAQWYWDTMIVAHILDNRSRITSVKFQAFVRLGIGDYDSHMGEYLSSNGSNTMNRIHDCDPKDLLLYNGMDSLLEYLVYEDQKRELFGRK